MKTLYAVTLYNHQRNEYARYLNSLEGADREKDAGEDAQRDNGPGWAVHNVVAICQTPDDVFLEI
jgi:hypothetical protein